MNDEFEIELFSIIFNALFPFTLIILFLLAYAFYTLYIPKRTYMGLFGTSRFDDFIYKMIDKIKAKRKRS